MSDSGRVIVVGSENAVLGLPAAMDVLKSGGTAIDAVLAAVRLAEANEQDHSVGLGGLPNLLGEVELDASIMDGRGLRAGAVGSVRGYQQVTDLAYQVMCDLPHSFLVGAGAERFATESGFQPTPLLTPKAAEIWRARFDRHPPMSNGNYRTRLPDLVRMITEDPEQAAERAIGEEPHGTVNILARDVNGNLASAVSTSGWAWKYPGRLGDSPVIGAGNYADNLYGAAACTGRGEMAIRACTAHSVVMFLRFGRSLPEAVQLALEDLRRLDDPWASSMNIVAIDTAGEPFAGSTTPGVKYAFLDSTMDAPALADRLLVPLNHSREAASVPKKVHPCAPVANS